MSFGTDLRTERERRGVTLADISAGTKIAERHLDALERDEHGELPGGIFNRGIVRGYCRHLGLNEDQWLQRFESSRQVAPAEPDWTEFAENVKRNRPPSGASNHRWWGVILMLIALAALAWAAWHYVGKPRLTHPLPETPPAGASTTPAPVPPGS